MKKFLIISIVILSTLASLGLTFTSTAKKKPSVKKYALLIGINEYPNVRDLKGCVNDISLMQELLLARGFMKNDITFLSNNKATKKNIEQALNKLIASANTDDIVVIHFSAHGSQVRDNEQNEEIDGLDETLIPYDYVHTTRKARKTSITDDELNVFLNQLASKKARPTLIIDACHSGGVTRNMDILNAEDVFSDRFIEMIDTPLVERDIEIDNNAGYETKGAKYVLITGSRSDQKSRETTIAGKSYGILTQALYAELLKPKEVQTWPDVINNVRYNVLKKNHYQTPQLEGDYANSFVFGDNVKLDKNFILVSPGPNNTFIVDAGEILGITKGSIFKVFPPRTLDFSNTTSIAEIEITETSPTSSVAKVTRGEVKDINSKAREYKHNFTSSTLNIAFTGNWESSILSNAKTSLKKIESVKEDKQNPNIVLHAMNNQISTTFGNDTSHILNTYAVNEPNLMAMLGEEVELWRKWFHVFQISNPKSNLEITVDLTNVNRSLDKSMKQLNEPDYVFNDSDMVQLSIKNLSKEKVFINMLNLKDNGEIKSYTLGRLLNHPSNDPIDPGKEITVNIRADVREGNKQNLDILKVFATSNDQDFDFLEQQTIEPLEDDFKDLLRDIGLESRKIGLDDWYTLEKVLLTKKKR